MSEVVLGAVIALVGVFVPMLFQALKAASEERRWYTEFFLAKEVEALHNLHAAVVNWYQVIRHYHKTLPKTTQDIDRIESAVDTCIRALSVAYLYLDSAAQTKMTDVTNEFIDAVTAILSRANDSTPAHGDPQDYQVNWERLRTGYAEEILYLSGRLDPKNFMRTARFRLR